MANFLISLIYLLFCSFFSYFTIFFSSFTIHILFSNLSSTLGANLDILEDKNCSREDKIVKDEITFSKVYPQFLRNSHPPER